MSRDQAARESVQTLLTDANPVPDSAVTDSWRDSAGRATYQAIVRTPPQKPTRHSRSAPSRKGFVIGTAVVAASVAAGLVISGVPSRLLGHTGTTRPPTSITHPNLPTKRITWPASTAKTAKGTAPLLHYTLTGIVKPGNTIETPTARSVLLKLARAAEHRAPLPRSPGARISFVVTSEWSLDSSNSSGKTSSVIVPEVDDTWFAPNGKSRVLSRQGHPVIVVIGSKETLRSLEGGPPVSSERFPAEPESPVVAHLSLHPSALKRELLRADPSGQPLSYRLVDTIRVLHEQIVSPRLDAAMWRVLAARPDLRYLGRVIDRAGRDGVAVAFSLRSGERLVLIISPSTGQLLGAEDLLLSGAPALHLTAYPAVVGYTIFVDQRWARTMNGSGK
jgi:hypothetical protein